MTRYLPALSAMLLMISACSDRQDSAAPGPAHDASLDDALQSISQDAMRAHLEFLADDDLRGRMTGTPEYREAADYVAAQFASLGLEPGGNDGWYQEVPLLARRIDVASAALTVHEDDGETALRWKEDFVMGGDIKRPESFVRAEVVYVGFGIHAPEMNYSDYDGIDVTGKIIAVFGGAPDSFPHNERAYYSAGQTKAEEMVRRGAIGWIGLQSRLGQQRMPWKRISETFGAQPGMSWVNLSGEAADFRPELLGAAILSPQGATALFDGTPLSFEEALNAAEAGMPLSTPLGVEVSLARHTDHEEITSPNVIGILPGRDPALKMEYVVFSAHLDHIGVGNAVDGDAINNGAYDNAMGVALLIEAARAFAAMDAPPKRSILFIAVTGEERGLLGSDYFAHYPTVPSAALVANVNLDMPLFLFPPADLVAFGAEHSSLEGVVSEAIAAEEFVLAPDPYPEEVLFIRSDQYSFVRQGVPAVYLVPGFTSSDPDVNGQEIFSEHLRTHYHRPSDDLSLPVDWPSALRFARANVRIGLAIADDDARPVWNPGDFFGEKFRPAGSVH